MVQFEGWPNHHLGLREVEGYSSSHPSLFFAVTIQTIYFIQIKGIAPNLNPTILRTLFTWRPNILFTPPCGAVSVVCKAPNKQTFFYCVKHSHYWTITSRTIHVPDQHFFSIFMTQTGVQYSTSGRAGLQANIEKIKGAQPCTGIVAFSKIF